MKELHNSLLALAASLLLAPAAFAQTDLPVQYQHEKYALENGVGFNKYLVSTTPNENSEYTLRLETFVTGTVKATALPTDFVLVLDNSGSMMYDYRKSGQTMPLYLSVADNNTQKLLIKDTRYRNYDKCAYKRIFASGSYNTSGGSNLWVDVFFNESTSVGSTDLSRYYYYEDPAKPTNTGYYYIYHRQIGGYYNLCIRLKDNTEKYLYKTGIYDEPNKDITADNKIIYTGETWRPLQRREELAHAVRRFAKQIQDENAKPQWGSNIAAKHQIAMVSFGSGYAAGSASIEVNTTTSGLTRVFKDFTEPSGESGKDSLAFESAVNTIMNFSGDTYIDMGVTLARMLFEDLQTRDGGKYAPVNASGGAARNKVCVVLTDGQPSGHTTASGYSGQKGVIKEALLEAVKIKAKRPEDGSGSNINGKVFSVDLYNTDNSKKFLDYLSSNYPNGAQSGTSGNWNTSGYSGTRVTPETSAIYYHDASKADLSKIFESIAQGSTGQQAGEKLVVMDVMSDSFELPANLSGKVKFYTAQCIGEKEIDGEKYLAFAREVPVDDRDPLAHLWVARTEGTGAAAHDVWHDLGAETSGGLDIDQEIRAKKSADGKHITVSGFEFVDLWCGKDGMIEHNNNTRQMASDDYNAAYAADGYRGFKLIIEFPIVVSPGAVGGTGVPTNNELQSGFYHGKEDGSADGTPIINYQKPFLTIPVQLAIQKKGLGPNESANFTIQRRTMVEGSEWTDYLSFVLTSTSDDSEPIQRILNLNPDYYYRVKEEGWSWAYSNRAQVEATFPSTEDPTLTNPIVIVNTPKDDTPKHAEAVVRNELKNY